ncbi:MAG TPA: glycoside hydrolase family 2 TIM barrel-domain containing protein, partial [Clostridia bacterium]|nr:glycoside hydrolase family 2 TIM barrel-domain containing protein [Clostridia bacterium]
MRTIPMDQDWRFSCAPTEDWIRRVPGFAERTVNLPHDFRLELARTADAPGGNSEAYHPGGVGFYEKTFQADEALCAGRALLCVDGAYRLTSVRLNRELVALHTGGYTAFFADLTGLLKPGENHLLLTVDASLAPASRWYTGAGLYRSVSLWVGGRTSIDPWGLSISTPDLCTVQVSAAISEAQRMPTLRHMILDESGKVVAQSHASAGATQFLHVPDAKPWHPDHPHLYTLRSELMQRDEVLDTQTATFGFRTVSVGPKGLLLNGMPLKLRGGCVHHDNGLLGSKSHPDAELRKIRLLKESGFNAVRCAHNPPSAAFLDACDALGMLVMDEAFDCWNEGKKQLDDHVFFALHWEAELSSMILRDRNHPSVICWSIGNEIVERSGISDGAAWSRRLANKARALDPTRPVCSAVCNFFEDPAIAEMAANSLATSGDGKDFWAERSEGYLAPLDICG